MLPHCVPSRVNVGCGGFGELMLTILYACALIVCEKIMYDLFGISSCSGNSFTPKIVFAGLRSSTISAPAARNSWSL